MGGASDSGERTPQFLYKYRSLAAPDSRRFAHDLLVGQQLYLPGPAELNDPFECRPYHSTSTNSEQKSKFIKDVVRRFYPELPRSQRLARVKYMEKQSKSEFYGRLHQSYQSVMENVGIFSMTTNPSDLLMWPHYADNHRGICIRIDFMGLVRQGHVPFPVVYSEHRPVSDFIGEDHAVWLRKVALTKGEPWSYEREWRLVENRCAGQVLALSQPAISGVILGANLSADDEAEVLRWVEKIQRPFEVLKAHFDERHYALKIERGG